VDQRNVPVLIEAFKDKQIKKLAVGNAHCLGLTEQGQIYGWGFNRNGQIGTSDFKNRPSMELITALKDIEVSDVFVMGNSSLCFTKDGQIYVWGSNMSGELGLGDKKHRNVPTILPFEAPVKKVWASSGAAHWFVELENGKIFGVGRNDRGQLGNDQRSTLAPVEMTGLEGKKVTTITSGSHHSFAFLE
jgi:alpha-tubulin suppressor-like RCC1 family protein